MANLYDYPLNQLKKVFEYTQKHEIKTWSLSRLPGSFFSTDPHFKELARKTWGISNIASATDPYSNFSNVITIKNKQETTDHISTWHFDTSSLNSFADSKWFPINILNIQGIKGNQYFLNKKGLNYFTPMSIGYHHDRRKYLSIDETNNKTVLFKQFLHQQVFPEIL